MGAETKIQWCHHTFNPVRGCAKISEGCELCYAATMSKRNPNLLGVWGRYGTRIVASEEMWKQPLKWNREAGAAKHEAEWSSDNPITAPARPRVFCASLADLFEDWPGLMHFYQVDEDTGKPGIACAWYVPELGVVPSGKTSASYRKSERQATFQDVRDQTFRLIEETPNLDWLLLTKRPENVMRMVPESWRGGFPSNVWIGTTVENQKRANERIPHLLNIPAQVRFLSCEPLLEPVDIASPLLAAKYKACEGRVADILSGHLPSFPWIDWAIIGGESGPGARPCQMDDIRSLVNQCRRAGVPCFVKQLGSNAFAAGRDQQKLIAMKHPKGGDPDQWPEDLRVREFPQPRTLNLEP